MERQEQQQKAEKKVPDQGRSGERSAIRFGIRSKLISLFILIKVIPLVVLALFAARQIDILGITVREKTTGMVDDTRELVGQVGRLATESSIVALDLKARENIERLTAETACPCSSH